MLTIGLDVHQRFFAGCILDTNGKRIKEFQVRGGWPKLIEQLEQLTRQIARVERELNARALAELGVQLLRTIPGVGPPRRSARSAGSGSARFRASPACVPPVCFVKGSSGIRSRTPPVCHGGQDAASCCGRAARLLEAAAVNGAGSNKVVWRVLRGDAE